MTRKQCIQAAPGSKGRPELAADPSSALSRMPRWFWMLLLAMSLLIVAGTASVWWRSRVGLVDLPLPADISDPEVRGALEAARRQLRSHPRSAAAWGDLGMMLQANGYGVEANYYFAAAQRLDPGDARWPYFRALAALGEDSESALPFLRQALVGHLPEEGQESAVRLRLAEALLERQEWAEAEELFGEEWRKHPGHPRAAFGLGLISQAKGQGEAAEKYLTLARQSLPVRKSATAQLAALARDRGDLLVAARLEKEFATLANEAPPWPDPLVLQLRRHRLGANASAQVLAQLEAQHRYAEAAKAYAQQIERQPTPQNYIGAGLNAVLSGQTDRGLSLLRKGITLNPNRSDSHFALAQAFFQLACAERDRVSDSRQAKDRFLEAARTARRATELKPDHAFAFLLWGQALMQRGEWLEAVPPLTKGVAIHPEMFDLQLTLGEALLEAGQLQEAEIHLKYAQKLDMNQERPALALRRIQERKK